MKTTCIYIYIYILILWVLLVCQNRVDGYAIGFGRSWVITCHSQEIGKILLLLLYYYHIENIWIIIGDRAEWYLDLDLVWYLSEAQIVLVPPMLVKDRPLHWILVRSQTYYPEHIFAYGGGKARWSLVVGFGFFRTDWLEVGMVEV